jgi:hypothetical protein
MWKKSEKSNVGIKSSHFYQRPKRQQHNYLRVQMLWVQNLILTLSVALNKLLSL